MLKRRGSLNSNSKRSVRQQKRLKVILPFSTDMPKKIAKTRIHIGSLKHLCGSITSDPVSMVNVLQDQFTSVFSDSSSPNKQDPVFTKVQSSISSINFNVSSLSKVIDELGMSTAAGEDIFFLLPPEVLQKQSQLSDLLDMGRIFQYQLYSSFP